MLLQKGSREDAIHALINVWLKDPSKYCGWCGTVYEGSQEPCCEKPFIGDNAHIFKQFYRELVETRGEQKNSYASTDSKDLRFKLSFPPGLLEFLEKGFERMYGEKLFTKEYNTTWFAKRFYKYFGVPEKI